MISSTTCSTLRLCNFADDNTIYACGKNLDSVISNIEKDMKVAIDWYQDNEMVANPEKFQLMFLGLKDDPKLCIDINGNVVQMTDSVKLLGITIDSKLSFKQHVQSICKKTSNNVSNPQRRMRIILGKTWGKNNQAIIN